MDINEFKQVVKNENLQTPVIYGEGRKENTVVVETDNNVWRVYLTGERADMLEQTLRTFDSESAALEYALLKLRQSYKSRSVLDALLKKRRVTSAPTHIRQINGFHREAFLDDTRPYPEKIRFTLNQMDGSSFWGFGLWRAPEGTDFTKKISEPQAYMQCIGSAKGMIIEVQHIDPDDSSIAYRMLVGKPGNYDGEPTETLQWDAGHQNITVYSSEIFGADEAASVLYGYFNATSVAKYYRFRPLSVTEGIGTTPESYEVSSAAVQTQILNQAIISYLGKGTASFPRHDEDAVRELVEKEEGDELLAKVKEIITGCMSVEIDWSAHSLSEAGDEAVRVMAQRYPELNNAALEALRWQFTYSNK